MFHDNVHGCGKYACPTCGQDGMDCICPLDGTVQTEDRPMVTPTAQGCKNRDGGTGWTNWFLFPRISDDDVQDFIADTPGLDYSYAGPGQTFALRPNVRHSPGHTLITQWCGYDV
jgi:hypothetical protein